MLRTEPLDFYLYLMPLEVFFTKIGIKEIIFIIEEQWLIPESHIFIFENFFW